MCQIMENIKHIGREERNKEVALKAISMGKLSLEEIAELCDITLDEVKELANGKSA